MVTHNIDVYIGRNAPERKTVVKCHDTGVNLSCLLFTEERTSKWRTAAKLYTPPVGSTFVIKIKKADGKHVLQDGTRKGSSTVFFELPSQAFTAAGMADAEINIFDAAGRRVTTETFYIDVPQEVADDCAEDSETYVSVMAQQIQAAIDAAERTEDAAVHQPIISDHYTWMLWNAETREYIDSEIPAIGEQGPQGPQGPQGENGDAYILTDDDMHEIAKIVLADLVDGDEVSY